MMFERYRASSPSSSNYRNTHADEFEPDSAQNVQIEHAETVRKESQNELSKSSVVVEPILQYIGDNVDK